MKNQTVRRGLTIFLFLLGLLALLLLGSRLVLPKNNTAAAGMDELTAKGILAEPENTIDVLFAGDSISYCSFYPMRMWENYGFTSYVCGTSAQPLYDTSRLVKTALERQSPKAVILETNNFFRDISMRNFVASKVKQMIPLLHYHNRWKTMNLQDFYAPVRYNHINHYKGFLYCTKVNPGTNPDYMVPTQERAEIPEPNRLSVLEIRKACQDRGIPLILVSSPNMHYWTWQKHNAVADFAAEQGLTYLDLNLEQENVPIDWATDTVDEGDHLNHFGAEKVTDYLAGLLSDRLNLPDRRQDAAYASWNESLEICRSSADPEQDSRNP